MTERSLGRPIPSSLEALVKRALAKAPADRPTAQEMRHELTAIIKGTDAVTLAEQAVRERTRMGALSRSERAITGSHLGAPEPTATASLVLLAIKDERRASAIKSALAVAGVVARSVSRAAAKDVKGGAPSAIIVSWEDERGQERPLAWLAEAHPRVPLLVVDVADADDPALVIRAGASDMALVGFGESELARRVTRLARRKR